MKNVVADIWNYNPLRKKQMQDHFTVIHYHKATPTQFTAHLQYLEKKYDVHPLSLLRDHYSEGIELPKKALFITFDDGWKSNYDLLPIIEDYEYPITIFLSTGLVGTNTKPNKILHYENFELDADQLRLISGDLSVPEPVQAPYEQRIMLSRKEIEEMSRKVDFQSHGVNHHVSSAIPAELLDYELRESKRYIQKLTGKDVFAFAFPYNVMSKDAPYLLSKHGYTIARAGTRRYNEIGTDPYQINSIGMVPTWAIKQLERALNLAEIKTYLTK
jgi:peptidoglycan/xylan/chitin deacetylase (PgdA/CDA1 family)